jgi:oligoribonuclease NrnB/cAMP/cGMP phosphodiesterase (DHH superfamily)
MKCFYHSADLDGHCSGAIVKYFRPNCELIGINYGDEFPWDGIDSQEIVFMVDYGLQPFSDMIRLNKICNLIWIDHHKSAIDDAVEVGFSPHEQNLRIGIGACQLVWEYFRDRTDSKPGYSFPVLPTFIKLLAEYDVWDHSDPRTLAFQYGMRFQKNTYPDNAEFWVSLFDGEEVQRITEMGGILLGYESNQNEKFISSFGFEVEFDGLKCVCANKGFTNSKLFDSVWDQEKYDAMLTFSWRKGKWTVSLYTDKPGVDVSIIAKSHSGGGHVGAAGFQTSDISGILMRATRLNDNG